MKKRVKTAQWDVFTFSRSEFLELLGLPDTTKIITVHVGLTGGVQITARQAGRERNDEADSRA